MLELNNTTPLSAELIPGLDKNGYDYAVVIMKARYNISPGRNALVFSDEPATIFQSDESYAEPGKSSVRYGSDICLVKQATDIVVNGHAYAPGNKAVDRIDATLTFANQKKSCRV